MASHLRYVKMSPRASSPVRGSAGAAGLNLRAAENISVPPGGRTCVKTDLQVAIPAGFYGRIAARSGLAIKHGVDVGGGVVDADFRGCVGVILFNHGEEAFQVNCRDRIAQLIIEAIACPAPVEVASLEETNRGAGGFGSTGIN